MFRCTECHKEYENYPQYCECGNDVFEEIINYNENNDEDEIEEKAPKLSKKERLELAEYEKEKKKSLIAVCVILFLCLIVLVLPPYREKKVAAQNRTVEKQNVKLPSVSTYWIDDLLVINRKDDPLATLPLLNSRLNHITPELREYLMYIGRSFNVRWNTSLAKGDGSCKVQFVLNKEGGLDVKNIVSSSGNKSLDDSVLLLLSRTVGFSTPPSDYRGEKIYILFSIDNNGRSKVTYPAK